MITANVKLGNKENAENLTKEYARKELRLARTINGVHALAI